MANKQINKRYIQNFPQQCKGIILLILTILFLLPIYAEGWKTTKFKVIQSSPPVIFSDNYLENAFQALVYDANETINPLNTEVVTKIETYLSQVAEKYSSYGFKAPVLDVSDDNSYKIYVYDYHDYYIKDGKKIENARARYASSSCSGLHQTLYVDRSKFMNGNQIASISYETLAHELFHAVQSNYTLFQKHCDLGDWIVEGTAEAMGIEMAETIKGIKKQPLVRFGARHYHTALRVGDDIAKRKDEGYWTASLWRYIGEYISSNGSAGVKQNKRPDYRYLARLFKNNITRKTSENKELIWLDDFLKSNESGIGKGLAYIYPKFITTFANYVPARGNGKTKNWRKCLFTNINCIYSDIEKAKPACEIIELSDTLIESKTSNIKFNKVSARCIKVSYRGVADNLDIILKIESNDASTIESLRSIGLRTNPLNKQRKIKVEVSSSGRLLNGKHFSEWTFQNVNFRRSKRFEEKSAIFVISNVAEKASKTYKNPEVSFTVRYPIIKTDLDTSGSQGD